MKARRLFNSFFWSALLGFAATANAVVSPSDVWQAKSESSIVRNERARQIVPDAYRTYRLNRGSLTAFLAQAPNEQARKPQLSDAIFRLPNAAGGYDEFKVVESSIMEPGLAAKFPQLKTYLGQGITDPTATLRFDLTPKGFHAQVIRAGQTEYIDPFQPGDLDHYIVYRTKDHRGERGKCLVTGETITDPVSHAKMHNAKLSSGGTLKTYRLAMAATGEYTQFHGGTKADALAAMVTTMNRVNGMYERDVSVRMVLVANNDLIIFTDPGTDPYANTSGDLNANQSTVDAQIGSANYDIGHLVGTGGGGIAQLGSVCGASKARGLTGSPAPVGDAFDIDYVAHEMGHQFAGNHTFNGSGVNCSGANRNASTAYEVGSGVTIQAYAGICGGDDLQPNSEDHFHRLSLNEILNFTTTGAGNNCDAATATGNAIPTVTSPGNFTIPRGTPFTLTATGSDGDAGDALTYIWEQFDLGAANAEGVLTDAGTGPLFRVFTPTTSPSRTFPSLRYILNNANIVPQTSPLPGTTTPNFFSGELLPTTARTLNFRVTVRDNRAGGGGTNEATSTLTVVNTASLFAVTAPNTAVTWATGSSQTVTWNVAGTTAAPISTANVAIKLSTDGGNTFPTTLIASTPNDGSELITVPAGLGATTTQARIKVEAVGNIYFDISDTNFTITNAGNTAPTITVTGSVTTRQGSPTANANVATVADAQTAAGSLTVALSGAPNELTVSAVNTGGTVNVSATAACTLVAPSTGNKVYPLLLSATDASGSTTTASVNVNVGANLAPVAPTYANRSVTPSSTTTINPLTLGSDPNGNFSGYSVSPTTLPGGGTVSVDGAGVITVTTTAGTTLGNTTIQVFANDGCGAREVSTFVLTVAAPNVNLAITASTVPSGNNLLEPNECNQLNVTLTNNGNITATNVNAVLSTLTGNVTIAQPNSTYADIPPGESRTNVTAFDISTASGLTCFSNINFTLTTSYAQAGSPFVGAITKVVGQPANPNYVFTATNDATLPASGATFVAGSNIDEGLVTVTIPAGFNFSLYGVARTGGTALRASANGNLQFRSTQGAADFDNLPLPVVGTGSGQARFPATDPTLFLQWDDWRMDDPAGAGAGAGIYTYLVGTAPNRQWIIEWRGRIRGDGIIANNNRAAIRFTEGSDEFDFLYINAGVGASLNAATSLIGIQSANTGTTFTQFSNNSASIAAGVRLHAQRPPAICNTGTGTCALGAGVTITQSGGTTNITEGGATDTYTVVLNSQPTANVTVNLTADAQVNTSPTPSLTFTNLNWNVPQTVTVTAVNDLLAEGAHAGTISHTTSSADLAYNGLTVANVVANITDNDTAGVTITQSGGTTDVTEGGATDTYTVVLNSQPSANVTITITGDTQASAAPTTLTFTTANFATPQTVTVTATNDLIAEGAHTGTISHSASGGGYTGVTIANVVANITDNDVAGVTITQSGGVTEVSENGATDTYTVVLNAEPSTNVVVTITPDVQLTVNPTSLTFTTANWSTPQTVTVSAFDDSIFEPTPHNGSITHAASGGVYTGVSIAGVNASITDNDLIPANLAVTNVVSSANLAPGQSVSYEVTVENLTPTADVSTASFNFTAPTDLVGLSWLCVADAGASCPASGSGVPSHNIALNGGTGVSYSITGTVGASVPINTVITTTATVSVTTPYTDPVTANNTANASLTVTPEGIFANGFE